MSAVLPQILSSGTHKMVLFYEWEVAVAYN